MASITASIRQLIGEATSGKDLVDIIDKLTAFDSNVRNDLFNVRGQILQIERMYANGEYARDGYLAEIARRRGGLLTLIDILEITIKVQAQQAEIRIHFLGAVPAEVTPLQVGYEFDSVKNEIVSSRRRDNYPLSSKFAATLMDLAKTIAGETPEVLHISSHAGQRGIVLTNDGNQKEIVLTEVLESVIMEAKNLQLLFMNSCNSITSAEAISKKTPAYVIGMNNKIIDDTAIIFSRAFYGTLCAAYPPNFESAFNLAKSVLWVRRPEENRIPELWKNGVKVA